MSGIDPLLHADTTLKSLLSRAWASLRTPPVPDYSAPPDPGPRELWLRQLDRVRDTLEQARRVIARDGWTTGGWFTVREPGGGTRLCTTSEAFGLREPGSEVLNACLVGTLVRLADDPDRVPTVGDVWGCVDELYEAMHERMGHTSLPGGQAHSASERRTRLRCLTDWNDAPGRTQEHVIDLLDRAISRTIVAACAA